MRKTNKCGFLYAGMVRELGLVKIGFSVKPKKRTGMIPFDGTVKPQIYINLFPELPKVELISFRPAMTNEEITLHRELFPWRIGSAYEWYRMCAEVDLVLGEWGFLPYIHHRKRWEKHEKAMFEQSMEEWSRHPEWIMRCPRMGSGEDKMDNGMPKDPHAVALGRKGGFASRRLARLPLDAVCAVSRAGGMALWAGHRRESLACECPGCARRKLERGPKNGLSTLLSDAKGTE